MIYRRCCCTVFLCYTLIVSEVSSLAPYCVQMLHAQGVKVIPVSTCSMPRQTTLGLSNILISNSQAASMEHAKDMQGVHTYLSNNTHGLPAQCADFRGVEKVICTTALQLHAYHVVDWSESVWVNISMGTTLANHKWSCWKTTPIPLERWLRDLSIKLFNLRFKTTYFYWGTWLFSL